MILSPNLGCPEILALESLEQDGFCLLLATAEGALLDPNEYRLTACPLEPGQGHAFELKLGIPEHVEDDSLPPIFESTRHTRRMVSTTLRRQVLPGYTFWWVPVKPEKLAGDVLRSVLGKVRATLYDLILHHRGVPADNVSHALCLRPKDDTVRFIHLTDLHVAARNDLWETEVEAIVAHELSPKEFVNFNQKLRDFIRTANQAADDGLLDLVLALGDLVDFVRLGVRDRGAGDNNWSTLLDILVGSPAERQRGNPGLRVPIFTTTGNHDWRTYPYPPEVNSGIFGMSKECAEKLDAWYHDTSEEVGAKIQQVHELLIKEGSPILAQSWWGSLVSLGYRGFIVGLTRGSDRLKGAAVKYLRSLATVVLPVLSGGITWSLRRPGGSVLFWAAIGLVLGLVASWLGPRLVYAQLRKTLEKFIAIETSPAGLSDYFLCLNPYFNYAFEVESCYFLILDTGYDCLTAQSFWDEGAKKLGPISIGDNILGGSPDTMAFFPPCEMFPYSQIAWIERVLAYVQKKHEQKAGEPRKCRVFVGLHTPVANLSVDKRERADELCRATGRPVVMKPAGIFDGFDIRYGTVNHYLSEFYYLCLGYREGACEQVSGPGIDAVLAGHAHWSIEFKLCKPAAYQAEWRPGVLYGKFSDDVEACCESGDSWWGPLLLQTGACGPPSKSDSKTPNFRYITVGPGLKVCHLRPRTLREGLP